MFKKPFKLKFQNQLKNSEKKKFGNDLKAFFPALSEEDISTLLSNKKMVVRMKITTYKEEDLDVYCIDKTPMYIDVTDSGVKLPTVFMMWRFPHMLPTFTTSAGVLNKLKNGANLFFPGIYMEGLFFCDLDFKKNDAVSVNLVDNKAAVAVGRSLLDKDDIMDRDKNKDAGLLVKIYHTVGDYLFKMQSDSVVLQLGPPDWALPVSEDLQLEEDSRVKSKEETVEDGVSNAAQIINRIEITDSDTLKPETNEEANNPEPEKDTSADDLLEYCFLKSLKTIPKTSYPILPATFYAKYILPNVPSGENLNLKKTKWKKFSSFLQEKSLEGLIRLQPLAKNDFTIAGADPDHGRLKGFADLRESVSVSVESRGNDGKPLVRQVYHVSGRTLPFFAKFGLRKRDELTRNQVRNHVSDYVKSENLADPHKPEIVLLDPILRGILNADSVSRGNLLSGLLERMTVEHKVSNCGRGGEETIVHRGKMPSIEFETFVRTGNKKVTVISNLESYGIDPINFSKELQHKAAASTSIVPVVPGKKGPQVQVQGNQIGIAYGILREKYRIAEKCTRGLEKALKPKSKK